MQPKSCPKLYKASLKNQLIYKILTHIHRISSIFMYPPSQPLSRLLFNKKAYSIHIYYYQKSINQHTYLSIYLYICIIMGRNGEDGERVNPPLSTLVLIIKRTIFFLEGWRFFSRTYFSWKNK